MKKRWMVVFLVGMMLGWNAQSASEQKQIRPELNRLDLDGDVILYMSTDRLERYLLDYVTSIESALMKSGMPPTNQKEVKRDFNKLRSFIRWSGIFSCKSFSMSQRGVGDDLMRQISFLEFAPADANKPMWHFMAGDPKMLSGMEYVPADAVLAVDNSMDAPKIWTVIKAAASEFLNKKEAQQFATQMATAEVVLSTNINAITASLDSELFVSLQFSETNTVQVPINARSISIPEPSLLLGLKTKTPLLGNILASKWRNMGLPFQESIRGEYKVLTLQIPSVFPIQFSPSMVQTKEWLLIATTKETLQHALNAKANKSGMVTTELYKKLLPELPVKVSSIQFISPRLMRTYFDVMVQASDNFDIIDSLLVAYKKTLSGGYSVKMPNGIYSKSYNNETGAKPSELIVTAYVGLFAAIGIPSFEKARKNVKANACINNLRIIEAAKQQWQLSNEKGENETPEEKDLTPYFTGGKMLKCPAGGVYTINPNNQHPSCSIHGHL